MPRFAHAESPWGRVVRVVALTCWLASAGCGPSAAEHNACTGARGESAGVMCTSAAVASWAVVGCEAGGCATGWQCDPETGLCERIPCEEDLDCPPRWSCDLELGRCD